MKIMKTMRQNPTFTMYTGPMFSGKTSRMLAALDRYRYQHKSVLVVKPKIDDRYAQEEVCSHMGWKHPAVCVTDGPDVLRVLMDLDTSPDIIAVDEAFMIPGIANTLLFLYQTGFTIVVSSLDISATGKPFSEIQKMLPWATSIEKCTAVCTVCSQDAPYTHKKITTDDMEIQVGGSELYEPRCFKHHVIINRSPAEVTDIELSE